MSLTPQPYTEHPNLKASIALIVDDPAPCINPLWFFRNQVDGEVSPAHERFIPLDFMEEWCRWVGESGVRGDFTVLPFPAGLGRVDRELDGCDADEIRAWMKLAKDAVALQFDIHPEILTHTNALDLSTGRMLPISEHEWSEMQTEETLADYFALGFDILAQAGLPGFGVTQPCFYRADESVYAKALLAAEKRINGRSVTHNFLHMDSVSSIVPPRVTHMDRAAGEAVVSIWTGTDDYVWNTQYRDHPDRELSAQSLADRYLTEDGLHGRLPQLLAGGGPIVMVCHWQSLYSNGSRLGLRTFREIASRISSVWNGRIAWRKLSEIAAQHLAASTARFEAQASPTTVEVDVQPAYSADILTVSIPTPWPLYTGPRVFLDGSPIDQAEDAARLDVRRWIMRGSVVTVSLPVVAGRLARISIQARDNGS
jgi:hypothetical protein